MTGDRDVASQLTTSLARRARAVSVEATDGARSAVDRRRARRARRRQARALAAVGLAVAVVASGLLVAHLRDHREVVSSAPGRTGGGPAPSALPRLAFDSRLGLHLGPAGPAAGALPFDTRADGYTQVQVIRRGDGLVPVIFAPWRSTGHVGTTGTRQVDVGGAPGALATRASGWSRLTWRMADGTDATEASLDAFGVSEAELVAVAAGLRRPDPTRPGYVIGHLPPGFSATTVTAPAPVEPARDAYQAAGDGLRVDVVTWASTAFDREVTAASVLSRATSAEPIRVMGHRGLLTRHDDGSWSVGWSPTPGSSAALLITGADRARVDDVVAALRRAD